MRLFKKNCLRLPKSSLLFSAITFSFFTQTSVSFAQTLEEGTLPAIYYLLFDGDETVDDVDCADATYPILCSFIMNNETRSTEIFTTDGGSIGVLEDVQVAEIDGDYIHIESSGIPKYDVLITDEIVNALNIRPKAATDFTGGSTIISAGDTVVFGQDVGYNAENDNCATSETGGLGYWPPGPACPIDSAKDEYFTTDPEPNTEECANGLGVMGTMVNGVSIFNWGDGMSYNGEGVFYNLAPIAESYDVDICGGHSAGGEYHHHFYTSCLADLVGDEGSEHSPIYGIMADGYALYGPYESDGALALSGWALRDYSSGSVTGCDDGLRSCVLVDEEDYTLGTMDATSNGPGFNDTVQSLSDNTFTTVNGYYYEDFFYTGVAASGAQLDEHNGHDNDDGRGYHYHITLELDDDGVTLLPAFPYMIGPEFYGALPDNAITSCAGDDTGGGGGPGGGGGGGRP